MQKNNKEKENNKNSKNNKGDNISKSESKNTFIENLKNFYIKEYKKLFFILVALTLFSLIMVVKTYIETGDFTRKDFSLKGGISISINKEYTNLNELESYLKESFPKASINLRTLQNGGKITGFIVEAGDVSRDELLSKIKDKIGSLKEDEFNVEIMGSSLGESFFNQMLIALLIAFLLMAVVFHLYFRNFYATFAAVFSAFLDLFITLGIMNLFELRLTSGGIAAYLMLIGYSIDTSILLSTKVLKEKSEDLNKRIFDAMKTGLTMSSAGLAAMGLSYLFTNNEALKQIMLILVVGLLMDIITTWIGNVTFLRLYLEKKEKSN